MYTHNIISIFNPIWIFLFVFKLMLTSVNIFFIIFKTNLINLLQIVCILIRVQKYGASWFVALIFCVSIISPTKLLTMELFSWCPLNFFLGTGLLPRSLVGLLVVYLVLKSPRTVHYSDGCPGPCMRQVFDFLVGLSTCRFMRFPVLSPLSGRVHDEAASILFCLMWPAQLSYSWVGFK